MCIVSYVLYGIRLQYNADISVHLDYFWMTVPSNGLPHATGPLSCLSVTLVYCG